MARCAAVIWYAILGGVLLAKRANADTQLNGLNFERLLDDSTPAPDGSQSFKSLALNSMSLGDGRVLLWNYGTPRQGAYAADPVSRTVTTVLSSQEVASTEIGSVSMAGGSVAFSGWNGGPSGGTAAIYYKPAGGAIRIINGQTSLTVETDGSRIAYGGYTQSDIYVITPGGPPGQMIMSSAFVLPKTGQHVTFASFSEIRNGQTLVLAGSSSGPPYDSLLDEGIYRWDGASLSPVANVGDSAPNGAKYVQFWNPMHFDGANYSFTADLSDGSSAVIEHRSGLDSIALNLTKPIVGSNVVLHGDSYGGDGNHLAFVTYQPALSGHADALYTDMGGALTRLVGYGDLLDGLSVSSFGGVVVDSSTSAVAFEVGFTNNTHAIYYVEVPEPAAIGGMIVAGLLWRRRSTAP